MVFAIGLFYYLSYQNDKLKNKQETITNKDIKKVYTLSGKDETWLVDNYKIVITPDKLEMSIEKLEFIANKNKSDDYNLSFCSIKIVKLSKNSKTENELLNKNDLLDINTKDVLLNDTAYNYVQGMSAEKLIENGSSYENGKIELDNYCLENYDIFAIIEYKKMNDESNKAVIKLSLKGNTL